MHVYALGSSPERGILHMQNERALDFRPGSCFAEVCLSMPRKILYAALLVCLGLIVLAIIDILAESAVPFTPQKRPASQEQRVL